MNRFQNQPWHIRLGRLLWWYPRIPWMWLLGLPYLEKNELTAGQWWSICVGIAQCRMNWLYTMEEVEERIKECSTEENC